MGFLKFLTLSIIFIFFSLPLKSEGIIINGANDIPIKIPAEASTGLDDIIVLSHMDNVSIVYERKFSGVFEWLEYSNLGGGYAQKVEDLENSANVYTLKKPEGNRGYIIRDGNETYSFWLVDYSDYPLNFENISPNIEESNCESTILNFSGKAAPIEYYTINGKKEILSRDLNLKYTSLIWDETGKIFKVESCNKSLTSIDQNIILTPAVLCNTAFTLEGDRFLSKWGEGKTITSDSYHAIAVAAQTLFNSQDRNEEASNQIGSGGSSGQSAPFTVEFQSFVTDALIHFEWQFSIDPDFENIINRFYTQDLDYTFTEEGNFYVRFIGSNADGSCHSIGDPYEVSIGSSELLVPNAFSPNGDGINDIWKVAYRSLIEFKCSIFDRYGHEIFYFDDPDNGWDGKNGTKFVKPGVYYYIIEAKGSDGRLYKKSGDINIINSKQYSGGSYID